MSRELSTDPGPVDVSPGPAAAGEGRARRGHPGVVAEGFLDGWYDLVLGSACLLCERPGRPLCRACEQALPDRPRTAWPTPAPPGLVRPVAVGEYAEALRELVIAHKERRRLMLARPLGRLLAAAAVEVWRAGGASGRLILVPVPSHPQVVRRRGHDPLLRMSRHAAGVARESGVPAVVRRWLQMTSRPADQAGLDAARRAANMRGRFDTTVPGLGRPVVLADDIVTTGATLREAQRALEDAGFKVLGAAAVAATRRTGYPHLADAH